MCINMFQACWFLHGSEVEVWHRLTREVSRGSGCCIKVWRGVARLMDGNEGVVSPNTTLGPAALGVHFTNRPENSHPLALSILDPVEHAQDHFRCGYHFVNSDFRLAKITSRYIYSVLHSSRTYRHTKINTMGF